MKGRGKIVGTLKEILDDKLVESKYEEVKLGEMSATGRRADCTRWTLLGSDS